MKKRHVIAIIIIVMLIVAVIVGIIVGKPFSKKENTKSTTTEEEFSIPVINTYYGEEKIASIKGYTTPMEGQYLRDDIIPINTDRTIPIKINAKDNRITNIKYEIRSAEDSRLIDNGVVEDWIQEDDNTSFDISVSTIMDAGVEYQLIINLSTEKSSDIYYYSRVMVVNEDFVTKQIQFAKEFSRGTLGKSTDLALAGYLEPDLSYANDNLGKISLKSSYTMLKWSELSPKLIGDVVVSAKEFCIKDTGEAGTYTLEYQVKAKNSEKVEETYNVAETIVVWTFNDLQYVLSYDREVNQVWKADSTNIGNTFIDLGIQNNTDIKFAESSNGQYVSFAINGEVYLMDTDNKAVTQLFAYNAENASALKETGAKVVSVDDDGNVDFLIYGYSPSNKHAGKNGISVFQYVKKDNLSNEIVFVPYSQPAEMISRQVEELCYVKDGAIYFMVDKDLYYVNYATKECGTIISGLTDGGYSINSTNTAIAYNTDLNKFNSSSITVLDFTTGKEHIINGESGDRLTVFGYTGENLVYGITHADSINDDKVQINKLVIIDKEWNEIMTYEKENIVITEVNIDTSIINIKRSKRGKAVADDQLIDNTEKKEPVAKSSYYADSLKFKELAISYTTPLTGSEPVKVNDKAQVVFDSKTELNTSINPRVENKLYVYASGKLQGIFDNQKSAEQLAKQLNGVVVSTFGEKIWTFEENYN